MNNTYEFVLQTNEELLERTSWCFNLNHMKYRLAKRNKGALCCHRLSFIVALLVSLILGTSSGMLSTITFDEGVALGVIFGVRLGVALGILDGMCLTSASFNEEKYVPSKSCDRSNSKNSILLSPLNNSSITATTSNLAGAITPTIDVTSIAL